MISFGVQRSMLPYWLHAWSKMFHLPCYKKYSEAEYTSGCYSNHIKRYIDIKGSICNLYSVSQVVYVYECMCWIRNHWSIENFVYLVLHFFIVNKGNQVSEISTPLSIHYKRVLSYWLLYYAIVIFWNFCCDFYFTKFNSIFTVLHVFPLKVIYLYFHFLFVIHKYFFYFLFSLRCLYQPLTFLEIRNVSAVYLYLEAYTYFIYCIQKIYYFYNRIK